jgi:SMODS-associated and fused to various effectors sensor domain
MRGVDHQSQMFSYISPETRVPPDFEGGSRASRGKPGRVWAEGLRRARDTFQPRGTVHLFLAVPAGLAVMIGQTLNTFGPIQTYEHVGTDAVGIYQPAALLKPSA